MAPIMRFALAVALAACLSNAQSSDTPDPFEVVELSAPDGSIRAHFIPLGATTTNLWVSDRNGTFRDIILGFDNLTEYQTQGARNYFGPVVGRYANRIRNGTFTIPISKDASGPGEVYHTPLNENNITTLHGGPNGFDQRVFNITHQTNSSVTFSMIDPDGTEGFPGTVLTTVTYHLKNSSTWEISLNALATEQTPIMLSGHHYWNLEAFQETQDLTGHIAQFNASRFIATDGILIPTGNLTEVEGTPLDFRQAKSIGGSINDTAEGQFCGTGCVGFDNAWVFDDNNGTTPAFSVWSVNSGIKLDITTNQPAVQIYSCNAIAADQRVRKADQGGPDAIYENWSCFVLEPESYIDGINNPEFGVNEIYGPTRPYHWKSTYVFSTVDS